MKHLPIIRLAYSIGAGYSTVRHAQVIAKAYDSDIFAILGTIFKLILLGPPKRISFELRPEHGSPSREQTFTWAENAAGTILQFFHVHDKIFFMAIPYGRENTIFQVY